MARRSARSARPGEAPERSIRSRLVRRLIPEMARSQLLLHRSQPAVTGLRPYRVGLLACQAERSSAAHLQRPRGAVEVGGRPPRHGNKRRPGGPRYPGLRRLHDFQPRTTGFQPWPFVATVSPRKGRPGGLPYSPSSLPRRQREYVIPRRLGTSGLPSHRFRPDIVEHPTRARTEHDVLLPTSLVNRRNPFGIRLQFLLPEHRACVFIERPHRPIAPRPDENEASRCRDNSVARRMIAA